jgi:hypothetical protein
LANLLYVILSPHSPPAWLCLTLCNADIMVKAIVLFWMTSSPPEAITPKFKTPSDISIELPTNIDTHSFATQLAAPVTLRVPHAL